MQASPSGNTQVLRTPASVFRFGKGRPPLEEPTGGPPVLRVTRLSGAQRRLALLKIRAWRQTVPYTARQIADAVRASVQNLPDTLDGRRRRAVGERYATFIHETDIFTREAVRRVLPWLATRCAICDAPAHYYVGFEGRCRAHRQVVNTQAQREQQKYEAFRRAREAYFDERDACARNHDAMKRLRRNHK